MTKKIWGRILSALLLVILFIGTAQPVTADPEPPKPTKTASKIEVEKELALSIEQTGSASYLIYLNEQADLSAAHDLPWNERGWYVMNALQETAKRSQAPLRALLDSQGAKYQAFWIDNVIVVESSDQKTFNQLLDFPEIKALRSRRQPMFYEPEDIRSRMNITTAESNLTHIKADQVWSMGYTGNGIVVANIDTGVRYTHNALVNHYRGNLGAGFFNHNYNWWDPYLNSTVPSDCNSHGSHTMGTMVGDDGGSNQIGMAPDAQWIACKTFEGGDADAQLLECGQFMLAPWDLSGSNPDPDMRPHIVNNSWGDCSRVYDSWYDGVLSAWQAAGIYPVFSNGNASNCEYSTPPGLGTVGNPARAGNVTAVGATGRNNGTYATYSNWGPTDNPDTINPRGYPYLKPQVVAPGTNYSAYNFSDTSYGDMSGTSMAAPHVAGLVALMWSAAPCLIGDYATTETIIEMTASPIAYDDGTGGGAHVPNYATGWGEIDALAAVQMAISECSPFELEASPESLDRCVPDQAVFEIDVIQNQAGFTDPVTLSAVGVPTGYTASFDPNPVTPAGSSDFSLSGSIAAAYGSYPIDVVGLSGADAYTTTVTLNLFTLAPVSVTLTSPANQAVDISRLPLFSWSNAPQTDGYFLELAEDEAFTQIVYSVTTQQTSHQVTGLLDQDQTYYWRVTVDNPCGSGAVSDIHDFQTGQSLAVLLVDDDDNWPDVRDDYTDILENLDLDYDIWDTNNSDYEPSYSDLLNYEFTIWFTGSSYSYSGPGEAGESALGEWLYQGNCFFLSSQDYHWNRGLTSFMTDYLGVESITDEVGYYNSITGEGSVFQGSGPFSLTYPFSDYSDIIEPNTSAEGAFIGNNGNRAAIDKFNGIFHTTFWAFPFEALSVEAREESLEKAFAWCLAAVDHNYMPLVTAP
jgi:subtilisin family serine protease